MLHQESGDISLVRNKWEDLKKNAQFRVHLMIDIQKEYFISCIYLYVWLVFNVHVEYGISYKQ